MTWSSDTLDYAASISDRMPAILIGNDYGPYADWINSDIASPTSTFMSDYPVLRAFDGSLLTLTRGSDDGQPNSYIEITGVSDDIDFVFLVGNFGGGCTVQIASDFATASRVTTIATMATSSTVYDKRLVYCAKKYLNVPQIRIRCSDHGYISQVVIGHRRQLSSQFQLPFDDQPLQSNDVRETGQSRQVGYFETNRGQAIFECGYTLFDGNSEKYGINDVATWRGIYSDTHSGTRPCGIHFDPDPTPSGSGSYSSVYWGYLDAGLTLPSNGAVRQMRFRFTEEPPYVG